MAPRNKENSGAKRKKHVEDEGDEDYRKRRDRNNQAVKRSRVKSKIRTQQTLDRVNQLKTENELLEEKIKMLNKELGFLKDLFLAHAGITVNLANCSDMFLRRFILINLLSCSSQHSINIQDLDLNAILADDKSSEDQLKTTTKL
ncbi:CCAAT/enhancer-binding protein homolog 2 isoform X1 [Linepithema humile]|uniref:CCAAT/enhancer-binding protein homolog 2 isoform X1 n=1 Tax=Linepithema humile TaxID=83485 RepID=UPI00351DE464